MAKFVPLLRHSVSELKFCTMGNGKTFVTVRVSWDHQHVVVGVVCGDRKATESELLKRISAFRK